MELYYTHFLKFHTKKTKPKNKIKRSEIFCTAKIIPLLVFLLYFIMLSRMSLLFLAFSCISEDPSSKNFIFE